MGGIIYLSLHCHHQNDSCIKMGSDCSHFKVSLIVRDKVTRQCPQTTTFLKRKESRSGYRAEALPLTSLTNALPLGHTGPRKELNYCEWNLWRKGDNRSQRSWTYSCMRCFLSAPAFSLCARCFLPRYYSCLEKQIKKFHVPVGKKKGWF